MFFIIERKFKIVLFVVYHNKKLTEYTFNYFEVEKKQREIERLYKI